jgi:hypothetical protein
MSQPVANVQPAEASRHSTPVNQPSNRSIDAVYEDGVLKPRVPLDLPSGTAVHVRITAAGGMIAIPQWTSGRWLERSLASTGWLAAITWLELGLLMLGVAVYLLTRSVGLSRFPIYFFCDEAILVVRAQELLRNGFRDGDGTLLPGYMQNADRWNLGLPVYIHLASSALFGKSVVVTRATSVAVSLLGTLAVAATLKLVFRNHFWWSAVSVMAIMPAWFLHTRTALDPVMMAAFYACFIGTYLLYRYRSPRYIYAALVFAAATCYSYPNGQAVVFGSAVLLLVSDVRYHLRQAPRLLGGAALLGLALMLPLLRFQLAHPGAMGEQLRVLDSYVLQPIPLGEKIATFVRLYGQALNPLFWFFPNEVDWVRHRWRGLGYLGQFLLPFVAIGVGRCVWQWRSSAHRAVLIAVLAAPCGAALYQIAITRTLAMVVPAALLACIGLEQCFRWLQLRRCSVPFAPFALGTAVVMSSIGVAMLRAALLNGPTWYTDYGLYGMQYGAQQVFAAAREELAHSPDTRLLISHTWANNPDAFIPFFLDDAEQARVEMTPIEPFMQMRREIGERWMFVMTAQEYDKARESGKFTIEPPERTLLYPDGTSGFRFVRLRYSLNADAIFAAERAERQRLTESTATINGQTVVVRHSQLDLGQVGDLFDGDTDTLVRGVEANPLVFEFHFPTPQSIGTISIDGWATNIELAVVITPADDGASQRFTQSYQNQSHNPHIDYALPDGPYQASTLRLEIKNATEGEVSKVHVREITVER